MTTARRHVLTMLLLATLCACGSDRRPSAEPAPVEPAPAAPAAPAPPPDEPTAEPTPEQLPLQQDFDPQAEQEITAANYRAALDALEREIQKRDGPK